MCSTVAIPSRHARARGCKRLRCCGLVEAPRWLTTATAAHRGARVCGPHAASMRHAAQFYMQTHGQMPPQLSNVLSTRDPPQGLAATRSNAAARKTLRPLAATNAGSGKKACWLGMCRCLTLTLEGTHHSRGMSRRQLQRRQCGLRCSCARTSHTSWTLPIQSCASMPSPMADALNPILHNQVSAQAYNA